MAQLNLFNGGLSTRLVPHLINVNESITLNNVDISLGSLASLKTDKDENQVVGKSMIFFKNKWVYSADNLDYVIFQDKLYYSGDTKLQYSNDGITFNNLGLQKPSVQPSISVNGLNIETLVTPTLTLSTGNLSGYYRYCYTYYNSITGQESKASEKTPYTKFSSQNASISVFASSVPGVTNIKIYRQGESLSEMSLVTMITNTTQIYVDNTLDINIIGNTLVLHGVSGTVQYCYTYYNTVTGYESQPSEYSNVLSVNNSKINIIVTASADTQVNTIRIYRFSEYITTMSLVAEVSNTTQTYTDNLLDTEILGDVLTSSYYAQPINDLRYLTSHNAMLFAASKDKLYFSEIAYVHAWSPYNFIDFDEDITGIGSIPNGLLVFTEYTTHIITGTSPTSLSKYLLSSNQGCLIHKSIKFLNNTLLWVSHDGICASSGTDVQVITRPKLGKLKFLFPTASGVYDDTYYLAHQDGIFVVDFRFGVLFYSISGSADCFHVKNNTIYYGVNNKLYSLFKGASLRQIEYRSPNFAEGSIATRKIYKLVKVYSTDNIIFNIYVDNKRAISKNLIAGINEIQLPTSQSEGYYISFEVVGTGEVYEITYVIQGVQSGN